MKKQNARKVFEYRDKKFGTFNFKWDSEKKGENVKISKDGKEVSLGEKGYVFRTIIGDTPMYTGNYYWEIKPS